MARSSKRTRWAVQVDTLTNAEAANNELRQGVLYLDSTNDVLNYVGSDGVSRNLTPESALGWALYSDTNYTSESPQTLTATIDNVLENNAGSNIETYKPTDISALYTNGVNPRIQSNNVGDAFTLRISFTASISNNAGYASLKFDIGDGETDVIISDRVFTFPKGAGELHNFSFTKSYYSLDTFITNGMRVLVNPSHTMSVHNVSYLITRNYRNQA